MSNNRIKRLYKPNKLSKHIDKILIKLSDRPFQESFSDLKNNKWGYDIDTLLNELGNKYLKANKYADAVTCYETLLENKQPNLAILSNLSISLYRMGRFIEALHYAQRAYSLYPNEIITLKIYLDCLLINGDATKIDHLCTTACSNFPNDTELKFFYAQALRLLGRWDESLNILDSLQLDKLPPIYTFTRADVIGETDSLKAIEIYENLESKNIKFSPLNFYNLSLHYLRCRNFAKGWQLFEYGLDKDIGLYGRKLPYNFANTSRVDNGNFDPNKWVMICSEQGIGDQLTFLSALPDALKEFKYAYFVCDNRMLSILKRSFPALNLSINGRFGEFDPANFDMKDKLGYIPLGSLLSRYRSNLDSFHINKKSFISVDSNMYARYREHLLKIAHGRKILGISWKSKVAQNLQQIKNLDFFDWLPLFDSNTLIVNLQYGDTSLEQQIINNLGLEMISFNNVDFTEHLDNWLSIAAACDGVTAISTSLVHFAGACGQKVSVVMPYRQGHWTLGLNDSESIFYPNVRIFRKLDDEPNSSLILRSTTLMLD